MADYKLRATEDELAVGLNEEQFNDTRGDIAKWLELKGAAHRFSNILLDQLALHSILRVYNVWSIIDEIAKFEGNDVHASLTKPAAQFKKSPLAGLWHKHHFQAAYLPHNLLLEMKREKSPFHKKLREIFEKHEGKYLTNVLNELSYLCVNSVLEIRAQNQNMTGEWFIYARKDSKNYYLTLANHSEKDHEIYERVLRAINDFPILQQDYCVFA